MTAAAGIEIGTGGAPAPAQGKLSAAAHAAGRSGAAAQSSLPATVQGAESFRTGWQSLLASLGTNAEGLSEIESAADQGNTFAKAAPAETAGKPSTAASNLVGGNGLRVGQGREKRSGETEAATKPPAVGARTGAFTSRSTAGAAKASSFEIKERKPVIEAQAKSASGSRSKYPTSVAKPEVIAAGFTPEVVPAPIANAAQTVPAPAVATPVVPATNPIAQSAPTSLPLVKAQLAGPDLSSERPIDQPTGFASAPSSAHPSDPAPLRADAEPAREARQENAEGFETSAKQGQPTPVLSPGESSDQTFNQADPSAAVEDAPPPAVIPDEGEKPLEMPVLGMNLTQTEAPPLSSTQQTLTLSQSPAQTEVPSQAPVQTVARGYDQSQRFVQGQAPIQTVARGNDPSQRFVKGQAPIHLVASSPTLATTAASDPGPIQTLTPGQNSIQALATVQNPARTVSPSQIPAPTAAPDQKPGTAVASNKNTLQSFAPSQSLPQTFVPSQGQVQRLAPSQNPTRTAAPSLNPIQTVTQSQEPEETAATSRNPVQTIARSQIEIPIQLGNPTANVSPVSMSNDGLDRLPAVASADAFPSSQLQVVPPIAVKTGSAGGGKSATPSSLRSIGRAGNHDSVQHESRLMEGQSSVPSIDQSALTGELAGVRAVASAAAGVAGVSAAATTTTSPRETFAALDATDAPATATWIHAGARQAEAGFQDPALGWIGVRADSSGGGVHAQLVPGSADAAQALGGHLEGLNAYLIEHRTPVETLTLTAPESGWAGSGSDKGAGQQMQQGAGQQTGQQTGQGTDSGSQPSQSLDLPVTVSGLPASSRWLDGGTQAVTPGGVHISVMA